MFENVTCGSLLQNGEMFENSSCDTSVYLLQNSEMFKNKIKNQLILNVIY